MITVLVSLGSAQIVDDFNRSTLGPNWTYDPEYQIVSNTLDNTSTATSNGWNYVAVYNAVTDPFDVSFKWAPSGDTEGVNSGGFAMLLNAASVSANGYFIMRRYGSIDLNPIVNGNVDRTITIDTVTPSRPNPAPGNTIRVVFRTDASAYYFDFYINGALDGTVRDNRTSRPAIPTPHYSGVCLYANRNNNIDDYTVRAQSITVTSPNGGEVWLVNSNHSITWTSLDFSGNIAIDLSTDGGSSWSSIVASTANTGSYSWNLPGTTSTTCRVRVKDATDGNPADVSDANFEIAPETEDIRVIAPNGGENWVINTQQEIRWYGTTIIPYVRISYSIDNGATWIQIIASTPNDGSFMWTVPAPLTDQALIRIADAIDSLPTDDSDATFSISALVTLRIPNSSGQPGSTNNIVNLWMDNMTNVRGVSLKITDSPNHLTAANVIPTGRASGFTVVKSENGTSVTIFMVHMSGGVISQGSGPIAQISYDAAGGATIGTYSTLDMSSVTISDANSNLVVPELVSGQFHYVKIGDLDADNDVDIDDINRAVDIAMKRGAPATTYELLCGDLDHDGDLDMFDLLAIFDLVY
ncbi:hypothetical protein JXO59_13740 [candidate division KSB1 bacterium]|nr:hypothetical protein [candidate division KSB1 bacterium]